MENEIRIATILARVNDFFDTNEWHEAVKDPKQRHLRSCISHIFKLIRQNSPGQVDIRPREQNPLTKYGARISMFTRAGGLLVVRIVDSLGEDWSVDVLWEDAKEALQDYHRYLELHVIEQTSKRSITMFEARF